MSVTDTISSIDAISPVSARPQPENAAASVLRRVLDTETRQAAPLLASVTPQLGQNVDTLA